MIKTLKSTNKLYLVIGILALPLFLTIINATILTIFNLGTDLGTILRTIYSNTMC